MLNHKKTLPFNFTGTASEMECPKTQCTLNESPMCDNDTYMYQHKQYSSLQNSEKTVAKLFTDAEMKNATNGTL